MRSLLLLSILLNGCSNPYTIKVPAPSPPQVEAAFKHCNGHGIKSNQIVQEFTSNSSNYKVYIEVTCEIGNSDATFKYTYLTSGTSETIRFK